MTLRENRPFRLFWAGQSASNLGDAFGFVAMPLLVFDATHSVVQMGNVTALTAFGQLFAATFSGLVVDRVHRRALMIVCDLSRLALYGSLPLLAAWGALRLPMIYGAALLAAIASNLFLVAYSAAIPNLVEPKDVSAANGRLQATQALTFVVGSALAGGVAARYGTVWAIGLNALSFAASALSLSKIQFRRDRAERSAEDGFHPAREIALGLAFLVREGTLRSLTLFQTAVAALGSIGIGAAVIDLLIYRLKVDFSESAQVVGTSLALAAFGAVLGALFAARAGRRFGLGKVCIVGTALQGLGLVLGGVGNLAHWVVLAGVFWSAGLTFRAVAASSLRQTLTPDALLGRVLASGWTLVFGASALGAMLVTRVGATIGVAHAMALIGGSLLVVAIGGTFSPLARAPS